MNTYEIRIIRRQARAVDIYASSHMGDHAAIRRAQVIAGDSDCIEVWRGFRCVYSGLAQTSQPDQILAELSGASTAFGRRNA